jgi:putative ABC transport system permease protein
MSTAGTCLRFAIRDLHGSPHWTIATVLLLSAASAAVYSVRTVAKETAQYLENDPRSWLGAEVLASTGAPATMEQSEAIRHLRHTVSKECLTMVASGNAPDPVVVTLRAVDPQLYPLFGEVELYPRKPLREALGESDVVLTAGLLERLSVSPGDFIRIGVASFRITGLLVVEPDRLSSLRSAYPRAMLSHAGFERSRIALQQSRISYRFLFYKPGALSLEKFVNQIDQIFPEATVTDFRHVDPRVIRVFEAVITFFEMTAWSALLLASSGAALLVFLRIESQLDSVAVLKALGARHQWIWISYVIRSAALAAVGASLGLWFGDLLTRQIASIERLQLALPVYGQWDTRSALESVVAVIGSTALVTLIPLARLRTVTPLRLLRRGVSEQPGSTRMQIAAASLVLGAVALWSAHSLSLGLGFLLAVCSLGGLVRLIVPRLLQMPRRYFRSPPVRYVTEHLARTSSATVWMVVGMTIAVMAFAIPQALGNSAAAEIAAALPGNDADIVIPGLSRQQAERLRHDFSRVAHSMELRPVALVRLQSVNRRVIAACQESLSEPEAIVSEQNAAQWRVRQGSTISMRSGGRTLTMAVKEVRPMDSLTNFRSGLIFSCSLLHSLNVTYEAEIRTGAVGEAQVARFVEATWPGVPILRPREYQQRMQGIAQRGLNALQMISVIALACCGVIVAAMAIATNRRCIQEIAILKILGAGTSHLIRLFALEFAISGAIAGALGGVLAMLGVGVAEAILLKKQVELAFSVPLLSIALATVASAATGLIGVSTLLGGRPANLLRDRE